VTEVVLVWNGLVSESPARRAKCHRRVLLEAATSTSRQSWATYTCPECGKDFRREITVPDHGAWIKAVETLLREGLGRVGEAEVAEPRMPRTVAELNALSWEEMKFIFAISYAHAIHAFVDDGDEALRTEVERWSRKLAPRWDEHSPTSRESSR
jgi:hypothetical protein